MINKSEENLIKEIKINNLKKEIRNIKNTIFISDPNERKSLTNRLNRFENSNNISMLEGLIEELRIPKHVKLNIKPTDTVTTSIVSERERILKEKRKKFNLDTVPAFNDDLLKKASEAGNQKVNQLIRFMDLYHLINETNKSLSTQSIFSVGGNQFIKNFQDDIETASATQELTDNYKRKIKLLVQRKTFEIDKNISNAAIDNGSKSNDNMNELIKKMRLESLKKERNKHANKLKEDIIVKNSFLKQFNNDQLASISNTENSYKNIAKIGEVAADMKEEIKRYKDLELCRKNKKLESVISDKELREASKTIEGTKKMENKLNEMKTQLGRRNSLIEHIKRLFEKQPHMKRYSKIFEDEIKKAEMTNENAKKIGRFIEKVESSGYTPGSSDELSKLIRTFKNDSNVEFGYADVNVAQNNMNNTTKRRKLEIEELLEREGGIINGKRKEALFSNNLITKASKTDAGTRKILNNIRNASKTRYENNINAKERLYNLRELRNEQVNTANPKMNLFTEERLRDASRTQAATNKMKERIMKAAKKPTKNDNKNSTKNDNSTKKCPKCSSMRASMNAMMSDKEIAGIVPEIMAFDKQYRVIQEELMENSSNLYKLRMISS